MTRKIHLIRHSLTEANEKKLYCGATDMPLSANGVKLALEMVKKCTYPPIAGARVYTSGLKRADETLRLLYGDVDFKTVPELSEMNFGVYELKSYDELKDDPEYLGWLGNESVSCRGGESALEMRGRVFRGFDALFSADGGDALILCHGGVIAAVMDRFFPHEGKSRYEWQPRANEGYTLFFENGGAAGYRKIPEV
jgi:alpha-ribazole phosphatase